MISQMKHFSILRRHTALLVALLLGVTGWADLGSAREVEKRPGGRQPQAGWSASVQGGLLHQFDADLDRRTQGVARHTAMLMIDVDHFTTFNDTHGHAAGDDVLRRVGDAITANVRTADVPYRYGGEEFCVLLPDATPTEAAWVAERVRTAIESIETPYRTKVTASVGVACGSSADLTATLGHAGEALVDAKRSGCNQVAVGPDASDVDDSTN